MYIIFFHLAHPAIRDFGTRNRHSFGGKGSNDEPPCKPFGIGKNGFMCALAQCYFQFIIF